MARGKIRHIMSRARRKALTGPSHSEKKNMISRRWAEVTCEIHGRQMTGSNWKPKQVRVPIPENDPRRNRGCPICEMEAKGKS